MEQRGAQAEERGAARARPWGARAGVGGEQSVAGGVELLVGHRAREARRERGDLRQRSTAPRYSLVGSRAGRSVGEPG